MGSDASCNMLTCRFVLRAPRASSPCPTPWKKSSCAASPRMRRADFPKRKRFARVILDVGTVAVKPRPNGPPRLLSPLFNDEAKYPKSSDPAGLMLTASGAAMLPDTACEAAPGRPDYFVLTVSVDDTDRTISRTVVQDASAPLVGRSDDLRALVEDARQAVS